MPAVDIHVRWMIRTDMPGVLGIERETFGSWTEDDFLTTLREKPVIGMVAVRGETSDKRGDVTGYIIYETVGPCVTVINLATTDPESRRALINKVRDKAYRHCRHLMWGLP